MKHTIRIEDIKVHDNVFLSGFLGDLFPVETSHNFLDLKSVAVKDNREIISFDLTAVNFIYGEVKSFVFENKDRTRVLYLHVGNKEYRDE